MVNLCKICEESTEDTELFVACWNCKNTFHHSCGKLSKSCAKVLRLNENLRWVCNTCVLIPLSTMLNERLEMVLNAESSPFKEIPEIINRLDQLARNVDYLHNRFISEMDSSMIIPGAKRARENNHKTLSVNPNTSLNLEQFNFDMS